MNSFERMGSAQLLAFEGQRQIAAAAARGLRRLLRRALDGMARNLAERKYAPW